MPCFSLSINRVPKNPFQLWQLLHANLRYGFYLGPTQSIEKNSAAFCSVGEPDRILAYRIQDLSSLNTFQKIFCPSCRCSSPRWIGYWGFSSGRWFDPGIARLPRKENHLKSPDMIFGRAPLVLKMDFINKKTSLFWHESRNSGKAHKKFERIKNIILQEPQNHSDNFKPLVRRPQLAGHFKFPTASRFPSMVRFTKEAISRGDIYQANISLRFRSSFQSSPIKLYEQLYEANPSPYACLLKCGSFWLVSNSPELLFKIEGSKISTRPIAGTRPRGKNIQADNRQKGQLLLSPKERAEHIMLVDLERNDLGRVCRPGTVRVAEKMSVERYSHVMHIVSQVEGRLKKGATSVDALAALFPGGTITGCPKIKSIQIIEDVEKEARDIFYGSAGYFCGNGDSQFNILIRTALVKNKQIYLQAGAGIVADSQPGRELKEIQAKAKALLTTVSRIKLGGSK